MQSRLMRQLLASLSPAGRRARLSILIFHRVLPEPDPLLPDEIDAARFRAILTWLREWFNVLPLREAVARLRDASLPERAACITFDDGYRDNFTQALPLLRDHGLHATFFVSTGFLDGGRMWNDTLIEALRRTSCETLDLGALGLGSFRTCTLEERRSALGRLIPALKHLSPEERTDAVSFVADACRTRLPNDLMLGSAQVRELHTAGMEIGAHTVNHPILAVCDDIAASREIAQSRNHLESLIGERVALFAYPNGRIGRDYTARHARMVADLGFEAAVSTNRGASRYGDDPFQLRRFTPWDTQRWRFGLRLARNLMVRPKDLH